MLYRIPHIRAVNTDRRMTPVEINALLAKTSLSGLIRQAVATAFAEAGLLSDGQMNVSASVDSDGCYSMKAIDSALAKTSLPLSMAARVEIKNTLARYALLK